MRFNIHTKGSKEALEHSGLLNDMGCNEGQTSCTYSELPDNAGNLIEVSIPNESFAQPGNKLKAFAQNLRQRAIASFLFDPDGIPATQDGSWLAPEESQDIAHLNLKDLYKVFGNKDYNGSYVLMSAAQYNNLLNLTEAAANYQPSAWTGFNTKAIMGSLSVDVNVKSLAGLSDALKKSADQLVDLAKSIKVPTEAAKPSVDIKPIAFKNPLTITVHNPFDSLAKVGDAMVDFSKYLANNSKISVPQAPAPAAAAPVSVPANENISLPETPMISAPKTDSQPLNASADLNVENIQSDSSILALTIGVGSVVLLSVSAFAYRLNVKVKELKAQLAKDSNERQKFLDEAKVLNDEAKRFRDAAGISAQRTSDIASQLTEQFKANTESQVALQKQLNQVIADLQNAVRTADTKFKKSAGEHKDEVVKKTNEELAKLIANFDAKIVGVVNAKFNGLFQRLNSAVGEAESKLSETSDASMGMQRRLEEIKRDLSLASENQKTLAESLHTALDLVESLKLTIVKNEESAKGFESMLSQINEKIKQMEALGVGLQEAQKAADNALLEAQKVKGEALTAAGAVEQVSTRVEVQQKELKLALDSLKDELRAAQDAFVTAGSKADKELGEKIVAYEGIMKDSISRLTAEMEGLVAGLKTDVSKVNEQTNNEIATKKTQVMAEIEDIGRELNEFKKILDDSLTTAESLSDKTNNVAEATRKALAAKDGLTRINDWVWKLEESIKSLSAAYAVVGEVPDELAIVQADVRQLADAFAELDSLDAHKTKGQINPPPQEEGPIQDQHGEALSAESASIKMSAEFISGFVPLSERDLFVKVYTQETLSAQTGLSNIFFDTVNGKIGGTYSYDKLAKLVSTHVFGGKLSAADITQALNDNSLSLNSQESKSIILVDMALYADAYRTELLKSYRVPSDQDDSETMNRLNTNQLIGSLKKLIKDSQNSINELRNQKLSQYAQFHAENRKEHAEYRYFLKNNLPVNHETFLNQLGSEYQSSAEANLAALKDGLAHAQSGWCAQMKSFVAALEEKAPGFVDRYESLGLNKAAVVLKGLDIYLQNRGTSTQIDTPLIEAERVLDGDSFNPKDKYHSNNVLNYFTALPTDWDLNVMSLEEVKAKAIAEGYPRLVQIVDDVHAQLAARNELSGLLPDKLSKMTMTVLKAVLPEAGTEDLHLQKRYKAYVTAKVESLVALHVEHTQAGHAEEQLHIEYLRRAEAERAARTADRLRRR